MSRDITEFEEIPFPTTPPIPEAVYVVALRMGKQLRPIYVGKTETSLRMRIGHYLVASKATAADFVVGTAVALLQGTGREVVICYRESVDAGKDESNLRRDYVEQGLG